MESMTNAQFSNRDFNLRIRTVHDMAAFPGNDRYPDGIYEENGRILFTIEINRHEILFFDCEV
jgi:hypothetical protein